MKIEAADGIKIGLDAEDREEVSAILNKLLADEFSLYVKTRNFHWNVTGIQFSALHTIFEGQYEQLDDIIDETAERVRSLGGVPSGSMRQFLKDSSLREIPGELLPAPEMLRLLLEDHEAVIRSLRRNLETCASKHHDAGTSDFLTGIMERHEKSAWVLRSHLAVSPSNKKPSPAGFRATPRSSIGSR